MFDFGWGEPVCVRDCLKRYYNNNMLFFDIDKFNYTPEAGSIELVNLTKKFIELTTGISYKHIIITHGTTGALNVVLRSLKNTEDKKTCFTHKYFFPYYPHIIEKNQYKQIQGMDVNYKSDLATRNSVGIVDSPSNPLGELYFYDDNYNNIIWDSVYHNQVFLNTIPIAPEHRVNCGGYSKVFGLTGLRVGWIATNSDKDYTNFLSENLYENCTMSTLTQSFMVNLLNNIDLDNFLKAAKYEVNNNREMFDKIKHIFDNQEVPENGMFYSVWANKTSILLLDKLQIKSVKLDEMGEDTLIRFNLAQNNEVTRKMTRFVLKEDGIV